MGNSHSLIAPVAIITVIGGGFLPNTVAITNAQMMGPMASMFCKALSAGVATGPQASICGGFGQSANLLQNQQAANSASGSSSSSSFPCLPQFGCTGNAGGITGIIPGGNSGLGATGPTIVPGTTTTTPSTSDCTSGQALLNGNCVILTSPVANAGPNQSVNFGATVTLDGTGSYATVPDTTITSYLWTQTAGTFVPLSGANTPTPSFIAPFTKGPLMFSLIVQDSLAQVSKPSTIIITVNPNINANGTMGERAAQPPLLR
jgi:K319-like protein